MTERRRTTPAKAQAEQAARPVLYRRWRPQRFAEVAGQEPVTRTLANAVAQGRLAHAYLFCGPRGTGKTSTGRILAKAVNCTEPQAGEPCNACDSCRAYLEGRALDLVEMDAASNRGIDDIRSLREKVGYAPGSSRYKVYLIDEVHELTAQAFDALLKTLEEPPPHVLFILATTEAHKVPATIVSRCQRFDFRRVPVGAIAEVLAAAAAGEGAGPDPDALLLLARAARGSVRDALNLLDQALLVAGPGFDAAAVRELLGLGPDPRAGELVTAVLARDAAAALRAVERAAQEGADLRRMRDAAVDELRRLLLAAAGAVDVLDVDETERERLAAAAQAAGAAAVRDALRALSEADLRGDPYQPLPLLLAVAGLLLERGDPPAGVQAAASEPAPPAPTREEAGQPTPAADLDHAEIWRRLRETLTGGEPRDARRRLAALLNGSCRFAVAADGSVVLAFHPRCRFHHDRVSQPANLALLRSALAEALGRDVQVRCTVQGDPAAAAKRSHLVRAALELGAKPLDETT